MKKFALLTYISLINIILLSGQLEAQWVSTNGPYGGYVNSFVVSENTLFAGTATGIFSTTDDGENWIKTEKGLPDNREWELFSNDSIIYARNPIVGIFRSSDKGENWEEVSITGLIDKVVYDIAFVDEYLFAATTWVLYRSKDNGLNWEDINNVPTSTQFRAIGVSGSNIFVGTYGDGVFRSTDNGDNWSAVENGLTYSLKVTCFESYGQNIYFGTFNSRIFSSTDNGDTWTEMNTILTSINIRTIAISSNNIFAGTSSGIFLSTDNGENWVQKNSGLTNTKVTELVISGNNIFAGTSDGVYRALLSDFGITVSTDEQKVSILSIYPNPTTDILNLHFDNLAQMDLSSIKIYSLFGNEIQLNVKSISESNIEFDVSSLPQGVYFVNVMIGDKVERMKFVRINN